MADFEAKPPPEKKQKTEETAPEQKQEIKIGIRPAPPPFLDGSSEPRVTGFEPEHLSAAQDAHLEAIISAIRNGTQPPPPNPAAFGWDALSPSSRRTRQGRDRVRRRPHAGAGAPRGAMRLVLLVTIAFLLQRPSPRSPGRESPWRPALGDLVNLERYPIGDLDRRKAARSLRRRGGFGGDGPRKPSVFDEAALSAV